MCIRDRVLNDLADSFCHSQKNAGLKGLISTSDASCIGLGLGLKNLFQLARGAFVDKCEAP